MHGSARKGVLGSYVNTAQHTHLHVPVLELTEILTKVPCRLLSFFKEGYMAFRVSFKQGKGTGLLFIGFFVVGFIIEFRLGLNEQFGWASKQRLRRDNESHQTSLLRFGMPNSLPHSSRIPDCAPGSSFAREPRTMQTAGGSVGLHPAHLISGLCILFIQRSSKVETP